MRDRSLQHYNRNHDPLLNLIFSDISYTEHKVHPIFIQMINIFASPVIKHKSKSGNFHGKQKVKFLQT